MKKLDRGWYEVEIHNVGTKMLFHPEPQEGLMSFTKNNPIYLNVSYKGTFLVNSEEILEMAEIIKKRRAKK